MQSCPSCGYANVPGTLFCEGCGAALTPEAQGRAGRDNTGDVQAARVPSAATAAAPAARLAVEAEPAAPSVGHDALYEIDDVPAPAVAQGTPFAAPAQYPAAQQPAARAVTPVYLTSESGRRIDVPAQDVVIVGREDMRSGIRPDVDLTLDGASAAGVSRRHCRLLRQADGWYVEDLMSTNFTVLNGKPLPAHTPTLLHDDDELRLGKMRLRVHQA